MLIVSEEKLNQLLEKYNGRLANNDQFPIPFLTNQKSIKESRIQVSLSLNITDIYKNYSLHYDKTTGASFATFIKWVAMKAMLNSVCNLRLINGKCYQFDNLPVELSVRNHDNHLQSLYYVEDALHANWSDFCRQYEDFSDAVLQRKMGPSSELPIDEMAHKISEVHFSQMTRYNTTGNIEYGRQPWLAFSNRYEHKGTLYLPLHLSFSPSTMAPQIAEGFINTFMKYANYSPSYVEALSYPKKTYPRETITDIVNFDFHKKDRTFVQNFDATSDRHVQPKNAACEQQFKTKHRSKL